MNENVTSYGSFFGGLPGQTQMYFTAETMLACGGSKEKLWRSLQQRGGVRAEKTFLPCVREYRIIQSSEVEVAEAKANPAYGDGGGTMVFVRDYKESLEPLIYPQNLDGVEMPSFVIRSILEYELHQLGNHIDYVDFDGGNKQLHGIYLKNPLQINELRATVTHKLITDYFEYSDNIFCAPEAGFICTNTRQFISAANKVL